MDKLCEGYTSYWAWCGISSANAAPVWYRADSCCALLFLSLL